MEKTLMEEESASSTQEAAAAEVVVVDVVTLEVEIATGVALVAGDHLAPGLAIAWSLRTSRPRPPGRTWRTSCAKQAKSTTPTLIRTGVGRELPSSGVAATWSTLWTSWTVLSLEGEGSGEFSSSTPPSPMLKHRYKGTTPRIFEEGKGGGGGGGGRGRSRSRSRFVSSHYRFSVWEPFLVDTWSKMQVCNIPGFSGPGPAHGGPAGLVLAPGPAQSKAPMSRSI